MNSSIRGKLFTGISLILVLLLSSLIFVIYQFSDFNQRFSNIVDRSAQRIILSDDLLYEVMSMTIREKNILLADDLSQIGAYENEMSQVIARADNYLLDLQELSQERENLLLLEFKDAWVNYIRNVQQVLRLRQQNEIGPAISLSLGQNRLARENAINLLNHIIDGNKERMEAEKIASNNNYTAVLQFSIAIIFLSLLLSGILSYWLINTVSGRILKIANNAKKIASREFDEVSINDPVRDELHAVTLSMNDILESFREITLSAEEVAKGDYSVSIVPRSKEDHLGHALKKMKESLARTSTDNELQHWMLKGYNLLNERLSGEQSVQQISENAIAFLAEYLEANIGALYLLQANNSLKLRGRYAFTPQGQGKETYSFGEGLIGQAALKKDLIHIKHYQEGGLRISSAILNDRPTEVMVAPFFVDEKLLGVIEVGKIRPFSSAEIEFFTSSLNILAININDTLNRDKIQRLLEETQTQSEELQVQQDELRHANEELEEQAHTLKYQQEELQVANEELEEQANSLEVKNSTLEEVRLDLEKKSVEIAESSRYKSEFLANMSHELRTPLNSLLILSNDLAENKKKNLESEQVESARIIYKSGKDLLQLINEVLDLSKIEAGRMALHIENFALSDLVESIHRNFDHTFRKKGLNLTVKTDPALPEFISTDAQRLEQVLKNLISNAIKFTEKGGVKVEFKAVPEHMMAIEVKDTGIGIPEEKQGLIFEAFQQADGGTSRKYGGTGLGLSISRQLAQLLGGSIKLESKEQEGACFSLVIPVNKSKIETRIEPLQPQPLQKLNRNEAFSHTSGISDDRQSISGEDKILLIIEDDPHFAGILKKQANKKGFKALAAATGEEGLRLAEKFKPKAIILDLVLPGIQGRRVLQELKGNTSLRHIPVHIISSLDRTLDVIREGAVEYLTKPVNKEQLEGAFTRIEGFINKKMKNLLVVEDDADLRKAIKVLIGSGDVAYFEAETGREALEIIKKGNIDCVVLDLGLPDISGFELLKMLQEQQEKIPPIIIYTGKELSREENDELQGFAETIIVKGVKSEERLLDETALFLHRTVSEMPAAKKDLLIELYDKEAVFSGKKILLVDDDMRNIFALSKVLKEHGLEIIKAENGLKAVQALKAHEDIALVLMDIMMPVMDGIEAMTKIRAIEKFQHVPIIALTAKAMKEDKANCMEAGANDYISKPIEVERLLSLMRVWIKK